MFKQMIFVLFLFHFLLPAYALEADCQRHHCIAVVDAGSTKSFLHVYRYDLDSTAFPSQITEIFSKQVTPGLSSVEIANVPEYIDVLVKSLPNASIPVYWYATAGMRLLPQIEQEKRYQAIRNWFTAHPAYQLNAAQTISGKEEGVFGWLSVNYQAKRLNSRKNYLGVMDMGGASVEIAFPITDPNHINQDDLARVSVFGKTISLYVHSFLGLGQIEMSHQVLNEPACYPNEYGLMNTQVGIGDWQLCEHKMQGLIQLFDVSKKTAVPLSNERVNEWYVIGGLSMLFQKPVLQTTGEQFKVEDLSEKARQRFCETNWESLKATDPNDGYLYISCLSSAYYYALLKEYGLNSQQIVKFGRSPAADTWALGVVLLHSSHAS